RSRSRSSTSSWPSSSTDRLGSPDGGPDAQHAVPGPPSAVSARAVGSARGRNRPVSGPDGIVVDDKTAASEHLDHADPRAAELLTGLNPRQREAVMHTGSPLLIVAGAGSGKTTVLTRRIAYALATVRAHPGEVLAITFTNKAARDMAERVTSIVGPASRAMWVSTFYSSCVRILRREAKVLGRNTNFTIYDAQDAQRLVSQILKELGLDTKKYTP